MIRQPHFRNHYGRTADAVADEALRLIAHHKRRMAIFIYRDGESQVCFAFGARFLRRCSVFGQELVGVYGIGSDRGQMIDDILASTYGALLREARPRPASGVRCAVGR